MAVGLILVATAVVLAARYPGLQLPLAIAAGSLAILGVVVVLVRAVMRAARPSRSADRDPADG